MKAGSRNDNKPRAEKTGLWENFKVLAYALGIALILRTFVFQPFHIPSPSMEPALYKGDYIITTKYSLGYGRHAASPLPFPRKNGRLFERFPERGDIIVFKPEGSAVHYIKRLIGLPGDEIQVVDGFLYINGDKQKVDLLSDLSQDADGYEHAPIRRYAETLEGQDSSHEILDGIFGKDTDDTGVYAVPAGKYFFMGDNRDQSADSRVPNSRGGIGYVAAENLVGRAEFVMMSVNEKFSILKPWTWINFRKTRWFVGLRS